MEINAENFTAVFYLLIFPAICVCIILGLVTALGVDAIRKANTRMLQFKSRSELLDTAELEFFKLLRKAVPNHCSVCPKVCLWDVIQFANPEHLNYTSDIERIRSTQLDFVVVETATSKILMVIELPHAAEDDTDRKDRDTMVRDALVRGEINYSRVEDLYEVDISSLVRSLNLVEDQIAA